MDEWWKFHELHTNGLNTRFYSYLKGTLEEAMMYCKKLSKKGHPQYEWKLNVASEEEIIKDGKGFIIENLENWMIKDQL